MEPSGPRHAGQTILIVEDEKGVLRLLDLLLTHSGYRTFTAMNGAGKPTQNQLQTIGIAIPGNLTLTQFQLVQDCLDTFLRDTLVHHFLKDAEHQRFQRISVPGSAALEAANETHLPVRRLEPAQR